MEEKIKEGFSYLSPNSLKMFAYKTWNSVEKTTLKNDVAHNIQVDIFYVTENLGEITKHKDKGKMNSQGR